MDLPYAWDLRHHFFAAALHTLWLHHLSCQCHWGKQPWRIRFPCSCSHLLYDPNRLGIYGEVLVIMWCWLCNSLIFKLYSYWVYDSYKTALVLFACLVQKLVLLNLNDQASFDHMNNVSFRLTHSMFYWPFMLLMDFHDFSGTIL